MPRTYTAAELNLAEDAVQVGQYARFVAVGRRFLGACDRLSNGLGMTYVRNSDGTFSRYFF